MGTDPAVCDVSRIMRVPGTYNRKAKYPTPLKCELLQSGPKLDLDALPIEAGPTSGHTSGEHASGNGPTYDWQAPMQPGAPRVPVKDRRAAVRSYGSAQWNIALHTRESIFEAMWEYGEKYCEPQTAKPIDEQRQNCWKLAGRIAENCDGYRDTQVVPLPALPPSRQTVHWRDLAELPPAPIESVAGMLPATGQGFLLGKPGAGKTFLAIALAKAIASGDEFLGCPARLSGLVVIIAAEGAGVIATRLYAERAINGGAPDLPIVAIRGAAPPGPDFPPAAFRGLSPAMPPYLT